MRALAIDENVNRKIVRGLLKHASQIQIFRAQQFDLLGADDPQLLSWAADIDAVLLSHDLATIPFFAFQRVELHLPMPGVLLAPQTEPIGRMVEEIICTMYCLSDEEWNNHVQYLPL